MALYNLDDASAARTQLISPPPEETLSLRRVSRSIPLTPSVVASVSKRKRNVPQPVPETPVDTTPNPKPRKQHRHSSLVAADSPTRPVHRTPTKSSRPSLLLAKSPHAENPEADYLPPIPSSASRRTTISARARRTTPIPAYEPPTDVFTPPRIVIMTPTISKSSKRKTEGSTQKTKVKELKIVIVKKELPPIDLSAPMPPPSPTDDPLLLSGPPEPSSTPTRPRVAKPREVDLRESLPPSSDPMSEDEDMDGADRFDWANHPEPEGSTDMSSIMDVDPDVTPLLAFNFDPPASPDDDWSDSDDDDRVLGARSEIVDVGEGEYTGRWRALSVRTKTDPPSSATRVRMEEWGRPITPFPDRIGRLELVREEGSPEVWQAQEEEESQDALDASGVEHEEQLDAEEAEEEPGVRQMSVEQGQEEQELPVVPQSRSPTPLVAPAAEERFSPPLVREVTPEPVVIEQEQATSVLSLPLEEDMQERTMSQRGGCSQTRDDFSVAHDEIDAMVEEDASDDGDDGDESEDLDLGVVKITSADPRAAARAAAILKQHDYECFTKIMMKQKKRHSFAGRGGRSVGVFEGGVVKARTQEKKRRVTMGVIGDRVYIPGSPAKTLPELLKEAEEEVGGTPAPDVVRERNPFVTPGPPRPASTPRPVAMVAWGEGKREWTKEEWKLLDACFTDERLEVGRGQVLMPVDAVKAEAVVRRFVGMVGGEEVMSGFGDEWNMENLLHRVKALQNKQRTGNVAPPTTPYTPSPETLDVFGNNQRVPSMDVPDFTPLGRRAQPPARAQMKRPVLPPPVVQNAPFADLPSPAEKEKEPRKKLPMSLLAPRYSHLLEEAIAVSQTVEASSAAAIARDEAQEDEEEEAEVANATMVMETDASSSSSVAASAPHPPAPATIGKRFKGFFTSYLPTLSKTAPPGPKKTDHQVPRQPGLPLPPLDVLEKPRGPIETPVRAPQPKPKHPKEIVSLHPAPKPAEKATRGRKPQRLVELQHVSLPEESTYKVKEVPRPRRSSGASVKDLVRSFEEKERAVERGPQLKRVKSIGEWRGKVTGVGAGAGTRQNKPMWRP